MTKFNDQINKHPPGRERFAKIKNLYQDKYVWLTFQKGVQNPFIKNISIVTGGTAIAQAITILISPIITRLYSPGKFGELGIFLSVVTILKPIAHLCYGYALVLPKRDEDSVRLLYTSVLSGAIISIIVFIIMVFFQQAITQIIDLNDDSHFLFFIPLVLFFAVISFLFDHWLIRKKYYKSGSIISITQSLISSGSMVGFGYLSQGSASLIGVNIFTQGFHALATFLASKKSIASVVNKIPRSIKISDEETKKVLHEFRDFPVFRIPQELLNNFVRNMPVLLLTILSGTVATGFYTLGYRVLSLPGTIISASIGKVFQQRIAQTSQQGASPKPIILKTTLSLAVIGILPFGIVLAFGPFLFPLVFGSEWKVAGDYARWMAILMYFKFINVPSVEAIPLLNLQKQFLKYEVVSVIIKVVGLIFGMITWKKDLIAIAIYSITGALLYVCLIGYVIYISKDRNRFKIHDRDKFTSND